ncbi:copper chaperone PCu(A)C [Marinobacter sp.]|uniref:copper chaperone PCu(A)C n=1 Tax=Marinobacter sp. TaxID=50741 RepID=UPI0034A0EA1E
MNRVNLFAASVVLACTALVSAPTVAQDHAHDTAHNKVSIEHPWSRPTPPGTPMGVGYMAITNSSDRDITLISVTTPRAGKVTIHESLMTDGIMRMKPLTAGLPIPAGETVELKPHGYHMMLEKLTAPLEEGERVPLTLDFDGADDLDVELNVEPLDGTAGHSANHEEEAESHSH